MGGRAGIVAIGLLLAAVGLGLGDAPVARAAAQPSVMVEVIGSGRVTGTGISCGLGSVACYATYASTAAVTLTATASRGWTLTEWDDAASACGGSPPPTSCSVTPGTAIATAVFSPPSGAVQTTTYNVALAAATAGPPPTSAGGEVTGGSIQAGDQIDCEPDATPPVQDCSLTVLQGSTITVLEQPDPSGFLFSGWGGSCGGTSVACATYLSSSKSVTATWIASTPNALSVTIDGNGTVTGGGISCGAGAKCGAQEPPNSTVTLTAAASSGYAFTGWGTDCTGTQPTCTLQMSAARTVTAEFDPLVPLTVSTSGDGTVSGAGIDCGSTCTAGQVPNSTVTLTAAPDSGGSVFWSGCTSSSGNTCTVTMGTTATSVFATFSGGTAPPGASNSLTVSVTGDGYVTANAGTASIYCTAAGGAGCTANVPAGTSITLSAVPASGVSGNFTAWSGDCIVFATTSCTLTMNGAKSAGATFAGGNTTYVLSSQVSGNGSITGAGLDCTGSGTGCSAAQAAGATVTLTAAPSFGATFAGWSGACSGTSTTCTVTMALAKSATATFADSGFGTQSLAIEVAGAGSVKASGGTCSGAAGTTKLCTQSYDSGKAVTLTAKAAAGYAFAGWNGACTGAKATCTVTLTSFASVTATFTRPAIASTRKPVVVKTKTGYRVTLSFSVLERGTVKLVGKLGRKTVVSRTSKVAAGSRRLVVSVAEPGRYVFTLKLVTPRRSIGWIVKV